jgi:very-short-patch-repair endonuclease
VDNKKLSRKMKQLYKEGKIQFGNQHKTQLPLENRKCSMCDNRFMVKPWEKKKTCSRKCLSKFLSKNSKSTFERRVKEGTWTSWRKNTEPSYPEKFFMEVLKNNDIQYEYECPIKRYSIDFAIHNKKIALEIDGQQHRFDDRIASDKKKDELLKSCGWKIYRIKWDGTNGNKRQEYIKSEIDKFISFYNSVQ